MRPLLLLLAATLSAQTNWIAEGPAPQFTLAEHLITIAGRPGPPHWVHSPAEYQNVKLSFDYRLNQWAEAMLVLRAPRDGRPSQSGIALSLTHDFHRHLTDHITGAVSGHPPLFMTKETFAVWHHIDLELIGASIKVTEDGVLLQQLTLDPTVGEPRGYIGFLDLGHGYAIRDLKIEPLPDTIATIDLVPLQDWTKTGTGTWTVHDGMLTAENGNGILYAPGVFADFDLTLSYRAHGLVNSGVFLRGRPIDGKITGQTRGFEVQIYSPPDAVYPTGSIYGRNRADLVEDLHDRWARLRIRVEKGHCQTWVNGRPVAQATCPDAFPDGRIGLQLHSEEGLVDFRDLRVRSLQ